MRRRRRRKQPDGPALPVVQCKPAKLVMHRSETSPAGSGGSTAGRALDPAGGGNGRPAQIRLPRASRLAAAGQGARLAGPPDPPGHLEPEFSGLNLHYVPPAGPAGPPARKLHPPGGEAGRTCRRPRPRRARRDKIRLAGWRETRRLAGSVSLVIASHAGAGFVRGSMPPSPSPRPEIDVWFQTAGGSHPHVLKHDILTTSSIYAAPSAAPRSRRAVSGISTPPRRAGRRSRGSPVLEDTSTHS